MKKFNITDEWFLYAESDMAIAKQGRVAKKILYSTLCFHCQQAAEKALKAILVNRQISFPKTHDINALFEILRQHNIEIP